jgi:carbon-monoxide dehydrogenase medium subunit
MLASQQGQRSLPLAVFFTGPGATVLAPDEMIISIQIPLPPSRTAAAFLKLGKRRAMAIAVASVAARLSCDAAGRVTAASIALGSVGPTPLRATKAEAILHGSHLDEDVIASAAQQARDESSPISDIRASADYRRRMVEVLTRRALMAARQQLEEE